MSPTEQPPKIVDVPRPPARVVLTHQEREAIEYELGLEVPGIEEASGSFAHLQDDAALVLWAVVRRNALALSTPSDLVYDDPEDLEWLTRRVFRTTLDNVWSPPDESADYWSTWAALEDKFGVDSRLFRGADVARETTRHLDGQPDESAGHRRIARRVAAIVDPSNQVDESGEASS